MAVASTAPVRPNWEGLTVDQKVDEMALKIDEMAKELRECKRILGLVETLLITHGPKIEKVAKNPFIAGMLRR